MIHIYKNDKQTFFFYTKLSETELEFNKMQYVGDITKKEFEFFCKGIKLINSIFSDLEKIFKNDNTEEE